MLRSAKLLPIAGKFSGSLKQTGFGVTFIQQRGITSEEVSEVSREFRRRDIDKEARGQVELFDSVIRGLSYRRGCSGVKAFLEIVRRDDFGRKQLKTPEDFNSSGMITFINDLGTVLADEHIKSSLSKTKHDLYDTAEKSVYDRLIGLKEQLNKTAEKMKLEEVGIKQKPAGREVK